MLKPRDLGAHSVGAGWAGDAPDVFEALGEFENAITCAKVEIAQFPCLVMLQIDSWRAVGRSLAKLGRAGEAEEAFQTAIAEAQRCRVYFHEFLAQHDYIVHVLDKVGRRDEQLPALGECITKLREAPSAYTRLLGSGLDAEAAVAAFNAAEH